MFGMNTNFNLTIDAILEKELYNTPPLMPVAVATIVGTKTDIPKAFRVTKSLSTTDLKHLRRIRDLPDGSSLECIICKIKATSDVEQDEELKQIEELFATENIFKNYRIAQVPSSSPRTDHQKKACAPIWPCKYAKCNYLAQCMDGSLLGDEEKLVISIIVKNVLDYIKNKTNKIKSGAVVFRCAKIYGVGLTSPEIIAHNPVMHSTMMSIDNVAYNAGAGHWKCSEGDMLMNTIQKELDEHTGLTDLEEPCFMCTMGLVQSRIRRLFYLDNESMVKFTKCQQMCYSDRAIEEFYIHREKNLNHRFEAWKISLDT